MVVLTDAEARQATAMRSLTGWSKEPRDVLWPTATSSSQLSQRGSISRLEWLPPHSKLDERGRLHELPVGTVEAELSLQFIAASEDGSIAFWDLKLASTLVSEW